MRILIDTNILIHLEDNKIADDAFYKFYQVAINNNCQVLYHPECLKDLLNDKDSERRKIIRSKLKKYTVMENIAVLNDEFSNLIGCNKANDKIDNAQLFQLSKGYVELFVTNDKGLHKKAKKISLDSNVLTSKEAFLLLDKKFTLYIPTHPILEHTSVRNLEEDFNSPFFESLRQDYGSEVFMRWIQKCAQNDRNCYRLKIDSNLSALLIYNVETEEEHDLIGISGKAIKICTLKVSDDALGLKLGELYINLMFQLAIRQNIKYVYVTTYDKQEALIYLLERFGFDKVSVFTNNVGVNENLFLKSLQLKDQNEKNDCALHPFFRLNCKKFIIPIKPQFYNSLFKDGNLRNPTLFDKEDFGLQEIQGNTIIKAYISKSPRQDLNPGDLLFFYSSEIYKSIEPVGVLIEHKRVSNFDELWNMVKSKTVYEQDYLKKLLEDSSYLSVTIFRLAYYLNPVIKFHEIKKMKSFSNKFQTITKLTDADFYIFIKNRIDESFIIH